jgi:hypothetical protein
MFDRYMSGRPNPWQPHNELETETGVRKLSDDLKPLGQRVVSLLVAESHTRAKESPLWLEQLRNWTRDLLKALHWNEAEQAAAILATER